MLLYHFTSSRFGLEAIRDKRLKIARIAELNDPFEFLGLALERNERRELNNFKRSMSDRYGMICLSSDWRHPLLWGHYGDKHQGIALGFEVASDGMFEPVTYHTARLTLAEFGLRSLSDMTEKHMRKLLFMKFDAWLYESEYRAFFRLEDKDPVSDLYFASFNPNLNLRQVIVGTRSDVTRARLADVLGDQAKTVETFKARPGFKAFEVVENKRQSAWK